MITTDQKISILKTIPLSLQHLFAMFSATVVIPVLFKINPATVLFFNGIGTLLYIFICRGKIPAFLGSSVAFISPVFLVMSMYSYEAALFGFIAVGILFCLTAFIIKIVGTKWIDVIFPPAAMGAIVAVIGLELMPIAANMAGFTDTVPNSKIIFVSLITLIITIIFTIAFKNFLSVLAILLSIIFGYIISFFFGLVDFSSVKEASWFALPTLYKPEINMDAVFIMLPVALVLIAEHVGHFIVIGNIMNKDLFKEPGLARSIFGNGISTLISGLFGSTPNTTYGENIGVIAITKVFNSSVLAGAAIFSVLLSFSGKLAAVIQSIPLAVIGGISLLLFGVIAA
ncbi:MAG: uracil permease, partial [Elusimicrobia bacterium]|nr:uracil permease [Elusimicrobiota bacterium]